MRRTTLALALIALVAGFVGGWTLLLRSTAVLPGMRGCSTLADRDSRSDCLAGRFEAAAADDGVPATLRSLDGLARANGRIEEACHQAGHVSAPSMFRQSGVKAQLYQAASVQGDCAEGFFHGTMIAALDGNASMRGDLAEVCASKRMSSVELRASCVHAIGHAVAAGNRLDASMAACEEFYPPGDPLSTHCYSGVFMQYGMDRADAMRRAGDIAGHCRPFTSGDLEWLCYSYVSTNGVTLSWPAERVAKACQAAPGDRARAACMGGLGNTRLTDGSGFCLELPDRDDVRSCMNGFFVRNHVSFRGMSAPQAAGLCTDAAGGAVQTACAQALGAAWKTELWPEPGNETCEQRFRGGLEAACLKGYRSNPAFEGTVEQHGA